ncbi:MAG: response regulator, partial [Clostridia bacterium]|nr:response regulator [Clostridia bacterium]
MIRLAFLLAPAVYTLLSSYAAAKYFQLESYQFGGYFRTLRRNWPRAFLPGVLVATAGCAIIPTLVSRSPSDTMFGLGIALTALFSAGVYIWQRRVRMKKPFVMTARVKRLAVSLCIVTLLLSTLSIYALRLLALPLLFPILSPFLLALAAAVSLPLEKLINRFYLRDAMKRLDAAPGLITIGITGSYGKTSTKFMLETILSEKYTVATVPSAEKMFSRLESVQPALILLDIDMPEMNGYEAIKILKSKPETKDIP